MAEIAKDGVTYPRTVTLGHDPELGHYARIEHVTTCKGGVKVAHSFVLKLDVSIDVLRWHASRNITIQAGRPKYFKLQKAEDVVANKNLVLSAKELLTNVRRPKSKSEKMLALWATMSDEEKEEFNKQAD